MTILIFKPTYKNSTFEKIKLKLEHHFQKIRVILHLRRSNLNLNIIFKNARTCSCVNFVSTRSKKCLRDKTTIAHTAILMEIVLKFQTIVKLLGNIL